MGRPWFSPQGGEAAVQEVFDREILAAVVSIVSRDVDLYHVVEKREGRRLRVRVAIRATFFTGARLVSGMASAR